MHLNTSSLPDLDRSAEPPGYERADLTPSIVHIGVGGFHRAHLAAYVDDLCRAGHTGWSIIGGGVLPQDASMAEVLREQDGLYTLLVRDADGVRPRVIGSITGYVHAHPDPTELIERIAHPDTAIVSLTVTEGGYPVDDDSGAFRADSADAQPGSAFDVIVRGLALRRERGGPPLTILSCDNVIGNGHVARTSVLGIAAASDPALAAWIDATSTFPNSMVDRITPATTDADRAWVARELGYEDRWPVATEPFRQWVVEDRFAGNRLPLEDLDVIVTRDVEPYELFKLRLLNASHSCMAYLARVAGHRLVHEVMAEPRFAQYVRGFLDAEAGPVVPDAPGIDLETYKRSLIRRFANPAIGDQVDRLCLDGSSKFPKFLIPTIRRQLQVGGQVELACLALAGWCRYLQGRTDDGDPIPHAADPNLAEVLAHAEAAADDPLRFLDCGLVFPPDIAAAPVVRERFRTALSSLQARGVRATLDALPLG